MEDLQKKFNERVIGRCSVKIEGLLLANGEEKIIIHNEGCKEELDYYKFLKNKKFYVIDIPKEIEETNYSFSS